MLGAMAGIAQEKFQDKDEDLVEQVIQGAMNSDMAGEKHQCRLTLGDCLHKVIVRESRELIDLPDVEIKSILADKVKAMCGDLIVKCNDLGASKTELKVLVQDNFSNGLPYVLKKMRMQKK